jgi:hypothetical protein
MYLAAGNNREALAALAALPCESVRLARRDRRYAHVILYRALGFVLYRSLLGLVGSVQSRLRPESSIR